jgi:hypothetical protein
MEPVACGDVYVVDGFGIRSGLLLVAETLNG